MIEPLELMSLANEGDSFFVDSGRLIFYDERDEAAAIARELLTRFTHWTGAQLETLETAAAAAHYEPDMLEIVEEIKEAAEREANLNRRAAA